MASEPRLLSIILGSKIMDYLYRRWSPGQYTRTFYSNRSRRRHADNGPEDLYREHMLIPTQGFTYFHKELLKVPLGTINIKKLYKQYQDLLKNDDLLINENTAAFIAFDENNIAYAKCLIIGPRGSPYENGCYLFDFVFSNFPEVPPKVLLVNTHNFRFNPNLYAEGKVCLSLLGTWSTNSWSPTESTIAQIISAIQSTIMNDEPYYNEPGYSNNPEKSKAYNENVFQHNKEIAILGTLKNIHLFEPFQEIIKVHFSSKRNAILEKMTSSEQRKFDDLLMKL